MALIDTITQLGTTIINFTAAKITGALDALTDYITDNTSGESGDIGGGSIANSYNIGGLGDIVYSMYPLPSDKYISLAENRGAFIITTGLLHTTLLEYYNNCPTWTLMKLNDTNITNSSFAEYCPLYIWKATVAGEDVYYSFNGRYLNDDSAISHGLGNYTETDKMCKICWDPYIIDFVTFVNILNEFDIDSSLGLFLSSYQFISDMNGVQNFFVKYPICNNYSGDFNLRKMPICVSFPIHDSSTGAYKILVDLPSGYTPCYITNLIDGEIYIDYGFTSPSPESILVQGGNTITFMPSMDNFVISGSAVREGTLCFITLSGGFDYEDSFRKNLYMRIN